MAVPADTGGSPGAATHGQLKRASQHTGSATVAGSGQGEGLDASRLSHTRGGQVQCPSRLADGGGRRAQTRGWMGVSRQTDRQLRMQPSAAQRHGRKWQRGRGAADDGEGAWQLSEAETVGARQSRLLLYVPASVSTPMAGACVRGGEARRRGGQVVEGRVPGQSSGGTARLPGGGQ
ncbi:hypothetical protein J1614_001722 [Plenodomus biglobosus]|nr:hypothetical protein J1614_001722 [Plenodomus biglobosus]